MAINDDFTDLNDIEKIAAELSENLKTNNGFREGTGPSKPLVWDWSPDRNRPQAATIYTGITNNYGPINTGGSGAIYTNDDPVIFNPDPYYIPPAFRSRPPMIVESAPPIEQPPVQQPKAKPAPTPAPATPATFGEVNRKLVL